MKINPVLFAIGLASISISIHAIDHHSSPTMISLSPPTRVDLPRPGADGRNIEPAITISRPGDTTHPDEVSIVWVNTTATSRTWEIGLAVSQDGASTWRSSILTPPAASTSPLQFNPFSARDPISGRTYVGATSRGGTSEGTIWATQKEASATSYGPATAWVIAPRGNVYVTDLPRIAAGSLPGGDPHTSMLYLVGRNDITSGAVRVMRNLSGEGAWSFNATAPSSSVYYGWQPLVLNDGTLLLAGWCYENSPFSAPSAQVIMRSNDGGSTLSEPLVVASVNAARRIFEPLRPGPDRAIPGAFRTHAFPSIGVDRERGILYEVYNDISTAHSGEVDVNVMLIKTLDSEMHYWSLPTIVNGDSDPERDQFLPQLAVDDLGRIHVIYFDTRDVPQHDTDATALVHVYYAYSENGGDTWTERRLTSTPIDTAASTVAPHGSTLQHLGDYIGIAASREDIYLAYPAPDGTELGMFVTHAHLPAPARIFGSSFD